MSTVYGGVYWTMVVDRMAGSSGGEGAAVAGVGGGPQTCRSLMSHPRKMMYSYRSSEGGRADESFAGTRSSVPKHRTATSKQAVQHNTKTRG